MLSHISRMALCMFCLSPHYDCKLNTVMSQTELQQTGQQLTVNIYQVHSSAAKHTNTDMKPSGVRIDRIAADPLFC